jgi:phospholipid/cholesterol/gamma-HCH transport system ATP-binding protein
MTETQRPVAVRAEGIAVSFGDKRVLDHVSFEVAERETLVVLGPSGCGKSTLLRTLIGLIQPQAGTVEIFGKDLHALPDRERDGLLRGVGVAFQGAALLGSLTVGQNVSLPLREHTDLDPATIQIMTRMKLEQVGLAGSDDLLPSQLSGGMRKRAGIARALVMDPRILFADEPSAGLDPITAAGLDELLLKLKTALGLTIVVVTHELESAFQLADRMIMLDQGRIRLEGGPEEARNHPDERVRQFFNRKADRPGDGSDGLVDHLTR